MAFISDLEITETGIYTPQTRGINATVDTGPKRSSKFSLSNSSKKIKSFIC
jgi:hypothetical protein